MNDFNNLQFIIVIRLFFTSFLKLLFCIARVIQKFQYKRKELFIFKMERIVGSKKKGEQKGSKRGAKGEQSKNTGAKIQKGTICEPFHYSRLRILLELTRALSIIKVAWQVMICVSLFHFTFFAF